MRRTGVGFLTAAMAAFVLALGSRGLGQAAGAGQAVEGTQDAHVLTIAPIGTANVRAWDAEITRMSRDGTLALMREREDTMLPGRRHERYGQRHRGLPVFGAEVTRQSENGVPISMLGSLYRDIDVETTPRLSPETVRDVMLRQPGAEANITDPELLVLPLDAGGFSLAYRIVTTFSNDILISFVDATTGIILIQYTDLQAQSGAGRARGLLGDTKKISTESASGTYRTADGLRPPSIQTFDLKGNLARITAVLNGQTTLGTADLATDSDDDWTDGAIVDAHVYAGWTYDYYFKRFGRRGLDNNNLAIRSVVHPVSRDNFTPAYYAANSIFFINAFWNGTQRLMVYGVGLPPNVTLNGQSWNFTSGAIDIVAHELTHGVTQFSSNLIYRNESGALNEAFSDIMATGVEFYYQQAGNGPLRAEYLAGEDVISGAIRSLANPTAFGHPDHYSIRYIGPDDGGGVHRNSGIANHAFYLAIEGGTNRVSGLAVQGVGGANREQIEKVFYRAFTSLMPASSNFFMARTATIQAARDLYGTNSPAERAVTQAWDAVGVTSQAATINFIFNPASNVPPAAPGQCALATPNFLFLVGAEEISGVGFTVASSQIRFYNSAGLMTSTQAINFAQTFNACSPGSNRIPPYGLPCAQLCVSFGGALGGFVDFVATGTDDLGNQRSFTSTRLRLGNTTAAGPPDTAFQGMCISAR